MADDEEPGDYIWQKKEIHDCFFHVGTEQKEKISAVKYFLANYSNYFRAMLLETDMKEKNSKEYIVIPDHEPDVFKLMLRFVYGCHDIKFKDVNQAMRFHILVDKCLMPKLKQISTNYLVKNCNSNLCEVLECAVLLQIKEMEPRAKKVVEKDTKALLTSPDFLNANPAIVEFIVKQEGLNVTEVELWRAVVNWAKRQCGKKQDGTALRKKLDNIINQIQFSKMSLKEFSENVVPTSILTPAETINVFVRRTTEKGTRFKEAPSKKRVDWLSPPTCILSFPCSEIRNIPSYNNFTFSCDYVVKDLNTAGLRISAFKIIKQIPNLNMSNCNVNMSLMDDIEQLAVATAELKPKAVSGNQTLLTFTPNIFEFYGDWVMKPHNIYRLVIKMTTGMGNQYYNHFSNGIRGYGGGAGRSPQLPSQASYCPRRNNCNLQVQSDVCTFKMIFTNLDSFGCHPNVYHSFVESFTLVEVDL